VDSEAPTICFTDPAWRSIQGRNRVISVVEFWMWFVTGKRGRLRLKVAGNGSESGERVICA
jgi:hypothetical protein